MSSFTANFHHLLAVDIIKRILFSLILSIIAFQQPMAQTLSERLDTLLKDSIFEDSDASLIVYDLDDDTLLYSYRENKLCRPASVMKVATAVVALFRLGSDYTVDTELYEKKNAGNGRNIYVRGEIDPLFNEEDLAELINSVTKEKIDTLYADCCFSDSIYWGPGWSWDDTPWEFQPYISPLMLCGGCVNITATPSKKGCAPTIKCNPESSFYAIANEATSKEKSGEKFTILRDWLQGSNVIRLRGDCNVPKSVKMNLYPSQEFFITVLRERLAERGIKVGHTAYSCTPDDATIIYSKQRDIKEIVREALMESNNLCAEALCYHIGALFDKKPVRQKYGPEIITSFIEYSLDINANFNVADGSGLSLYNYLSADIILQILRRAHCSNDVYEIIKNSLPTMGVSGTLKERGTTSTAQGRIHAKTGSIKGIATLAGYVDAANGHTLAFVIINQNTLNIKNARKWQDRVCDALCQ